MNYWIFHINSDFFLTLNDRPSTILKSVEVSGQIFFVIKEGHSVYKFHLQTYVELGIHRTRIYTSHTNITILHFPGFRRGIT